MAFSAALSVNPRISGPDATPEAGFLIKCLEFPGKNGFSPNFVQIKNPAERSFPQAASGMPVRVRRAFNACCTCLRERWHKNVSPSTGSPAWGKNVLPGPFRSSCRIQPPGRLLICRARRPGPDVYARSGGLVANLAAMELSVL